MNTKIIVGIVVVVVVAGFVVYFAVGGSGGTRTPVIQTNNGGVYSGASASNTSNVMSPADTYLAYKKDLFTKTTTAEDVVALARKYLPGVIAQGWDAAGGPSGVFSKPVAVCAWVHAQRMISPDAALVKVDSAKTVNAKSVELEVSAAGGYKGRADMALEQDGWKVSQELWPNWVPRMVPCPD